MTTLSEPDTWLVNEDIEELREHQGSRPFRPSVNQSVDGGMLRLVNSLEAERSKDTDCALQLRNHHHP